MAVDTGIGTYREKQKNLIIEFRIVCESKKLRANVAKTKVMRCSKNGGVPGAQTIMNSKTLV